MNLRTPILGLAVLSLTAALASAHDFWMEPSNYRPKKGERVSLDLKVGEHFAGESVERNDLRIVSFVARGPDGRDADVIGVDGRAPAGLWSARADGLQQIAYRSRTTALELEAAKFEAYLTAEGLEHVIAARKTRGESAKKGIEIYSRSVKTMVLAGGATPESSKGFDARMGLTLEIVPEVNPYALKVGDELPVHVWFQDKPLARALVGCTALADTQDDVRLRTDENGRVVFRVAHPGPTLLRVCWMTEAPKDSQADWESTWSSLTFAVPVESTPKPEPTPKPSPAPAPTPAPK